MLLYINKIISYDLFNFNSQKIPTENSVKRHERAKKRKQSIVTQQPESLTSVAETESAATTLLAFSHSSPFKENSGKVFLLQKIYKSTIYPKQCCRCYE